MCDQHGLQRCPLSLAQRGQKEMFKGLDEAHWIKESMGIPEPNKLVGRPK